MKAVMIIYNQAHTEKVDYMLISLKIRGYSQFPEVMGRGSETGDPRQGTHTWPEINAATLVVTEDEMVDQLLEKVKKIDAINEEVGIRAFVWDITRTV